MNEKEIIEFVRTTASRPLKIRELSKAMNIVPAEYGRFRRMVKRLLADGELVNIKRGRIGLPEQLDLLVGRVSITKAGTGFLIREDNVDDEQDLLIPSEFLSTALDGDKVMVRREGHMRGREAGSVIKILERARRKLVGVFHKTPHFNLVTPDDQRIHRDIYIPQADILGAKQGQKVVVELSEWEDAYRNPEGRITEILGKPGSARVDLLAIMRSFDLIEEFPQEVTRLAEESAALMTDEAVAEREDFRQALIYTIDPADAKDHDDAFHVERMDGGYRLGVHIADVSFFVREGTLLDSEAFERGNSTYLPGKVIPMLPEALSNDWCSLRENKDRLAHSVIIDFDKSGKAINWRISDTVVRSQAKLSYEDAQSVFDGAPATESAGRLSDELLLARELAQKVAALRFADGSLDFDLPESRIELDESGEVVRLSQRVRLESHRLVEEFMLAANKAVALTVSRAAQPFLYRVHDRPDLEKLEAFAELAASCGYHFAVSDTVSPRLVQSFLETIKGAPEEEYLSELALRSMKKAVYQPENLGHFGLAFRHYTHFTSPIRRYPDLLVHRSLRKLHNGRYPVRYAEKLKRTLPEIGKHCSETERVSERAERTAVKMLQTMYLKKHIGDEFNGIISGVVGRGFFVRLDGISSEGMVRVSAIDDDFYHFDEARHRLIGSRKRRAFRLGDRVRVMIEQVDVIRREVDLQLISHESAEPVKKPEGKTALMSDRKKSRRAVKKSGAKSTSPKKTARKTLSPRKGRKKR